MDLALNNLHWLICHKTKSNQFEPQSSFTSHIKFSVFLWWRIKIGIYLCSLPCIKKHMRASNQENNDSSLGTQIFHSPVIGLWICQLHPLKRIKIPQKYLKGILWEIFKKWLALWILLQEKNHVNYLNNELYHLKYQFVNVRLKIH